MTTSYKRWDITPYTTASHANIPPPSFNSKKAVFLTISVGVFS